MRDVDFPALAEDGSSDPSKEQSFIFYTFLPGNSLVIDKQLILSKNI